VCCTSSRYQSSSRMFDNFDMRLTYFMFARKGRLGTSQVIRTRHLHWAKHAVTTFYLGEGETPETQVSIHWLRVNVRCNATHGKPLIRTFYVLRSGDEKGIRSLNDVLSLRKERVFPRRVAVSNDMNQLSDWISGFWEDILWYCYSILL
jgi:hypothetical protein